MSSRRPALPLRGILSALALTGILYVAGFAFEIGRVLRPTATQLQGRTSELLAGHDAIAASLDRMREMRRVVAARVSTVQGTAADTGSGMALRESIRGLLDASVATRASVERSEAPPEMRLLLATATEVETSTGLSLLEALRASEQRQTATAVDALRRVALGIDSTASLLNAAQRVALLEVLRGEEELATSLQQFARWAVIWGVAGGLLFALGALVVHRRLYRPVLEMEHTVRRIAEGDLTAEVPVTRRDELGRLGEHLNEMTAMLRERTLEEERRRENLAERFGRILDESTNEICVFDAVTLRAVQANRGARMNLGYARAELGELTLGAMLGEIGAETLHAHLDRLRRGEQPRVFLATRQVRRDGTTYPAETTLQYSTDGQSAVFVTVTEDAQLRERVRELDGRLRDFALEQQRVLNGGDLPAALRVITEMAAEALGASRVSVWRPSGAGLRCAAVFDARDRTHSAGEGIAWPAASDVAYHPLEAPVRASGALVGAVRFEQLDAPRKWTAEDHTFAAAVAELVARARDAAERRSLELELARVQRMDSIGQLAGGIAHDFNNILTAILGNLEQCRADLAPDDPLHDGLAEAEDAARRAADLTRQLLTFARHQVVDARVMDLNAVAREAERMLRRLVGANIEMRTEWDPALRPVRVAPSQMEQVLVNLVVNARDAMPNGGRLVLATRNATLDEGFAADHPEVQPGEYVQLSVSDTGAGMDRATADRVFEPFFTTKAVGKGTGLGLAVCYGIVRQAGGVVTVYSEPGRGSRFNVYLPAAEAAAEQEAAPAARPSAGGTETLLVVEDDAAIRALLVRALGARGYLVLEAADGEAAMGAAAAHAGTIDLLVSDVVMPRMNGPELARRLREVRPHLLVIFMSGYTADALVADGPVSADGFIGKPFTPEEAARRVREVLDAAAAGRPARRISR